MLDTKKWNLIWLLSLAMVCCLMLCMSFHYGLSGDEVDMNEYGKAILKYFTSGFSDQTVFNMPKEFNRDGTINYYGGFFDLICAIINKISPFEEYTTRHLMNALFGFLAILYASKIARRIMDIQAGILCCWLLFLSPFFLGHAMNNPKDIPFATLYIMAIYYSINLLQQVPHATWKQYLWAILTIGACINIRVGGILLLPYLGVLSAILFFWNKFILKESISIQQYIKPIIITGVLGYFAGSIFWPYGLQNPISNPLTALSEMSNIKVNLAQLFEGEKLYSSELPENFLIKSFCITNTYALLIGLALGLFFLFKYFRQKNGSIYFFIVFTALFPLAYVIYAHSNVYHGWRHLLFIFPSMGVVAALGWRALIIYIAPKQKWAGVAVTLLCVLLLCQPLIFIARTFPNTVCYFNGTVGGVKGAYGNYEMDYYYNSVKQCTDYFIKNEYPKLGEKDTVLMASNCVHLLYQYFKKYPKVQCMYLRYPERCTKDWEYGIFHTALIPIEEIRASSWVSPLSIFTARVDGKPLSTLYKRISHDDVKAIHYLEKQQADSAFYCFRNYLRTDPNNLFVLQTMGDIYKQIGINDSAAKYLQMATKVITTEELQD